MCRSLIAALAILLVFAIPATAGKLTAVPDNDGFSASKITADCRVQGVLMFDPPCNQVRWTYGGWCIEDEIAHLFNLQDDACLAGCPATNGYAMIESAEVDWRCVPPATYPFTTYPFDVSFLVYLPDPVLGTPECPLPQIVIECESPVVTIAARTLTASTDPARNFTQIIPFPAGCCVQVAPMFGALKFVYIPDVALITECGGLATTPWWIPGPRGYNGDPAQTSCESPCAQYFRNIPMWGEDWFILGVLTDYAWFLNISCYDCGVAVEKTTWGKVKGLMNN